MGAGLSRCMGSASSSIVAPFMTPRCARSNKKYASDTLTDACGMLHRTFYRRNVLYTVFVAWRHTSIRAKLDRIQASMVHQDEALAHITARMQEVEATASRSLSKIHRQESEEGEGRGRRRSTQGTRTCMACAEDCRTFIECTNRHAFCLSCVDSMAKMQLERMTRPSDSCVCMAMNENCDGILRESDLAVTINGRKLICEIAHSRTMDKILSLIETKQEESGLANILTLHLQRLRHDGSYRAYACPRCSFGPIDHAHCDNLVEHHDREGVNNACPRCGFFVNDVSQLKVWSG